MSVHTNNKKPQYEPASLFSLSRQLLLAAKTGESTDSLTLLFTKINKDDISKQLNNDDKKKAFWINLYNAYTQIILMRNPLKYKNRSLFFSARQINIGGLKISLDEIEHGILRRSKIKWSGGYLTKILPSKFEKANRVENLDYRIHFALNCGARSCPPIAFYDPLKLDRQLDLATRVYLENEATYHPAENSVTLPAIMSWFRADFGGKKGMVALLKNLGIIPAGTSPKINFKKYNWKLFLENYKNESNEQSLL